MRKIKERILKMKNIVLLTVAIFLGLSFIGCKQGGAGKFHNILNKSQIPIKIQQDGKTTLELKSGECVSLTQEQVIKLNVQENDTREFLYILTRANDYLCGNTKTAGSTSTSGTKCIVTKRSVIVENEEGDHVLVDEEEGEKISAAVKAANEEDSEEVAESKKYNFNNCKPLSTGEEKDGEEEGEEEEEEEEA